MTSHPGVTSYVNYDLSPRGDKQLGCALAAHAKAKMTYLID